MLNMEQNILITKTVRYYGKEIPIENLSKWSDKKIQVRCPICNKNREVYAKSLFIAGTSICHNCKLSGREKLLEIGDNYNRWTISNKGIKTGFSLCKCKCGEIKEVSNSSLKRGLSKSCGCLNIEQLQDRRKYLKIGTQYGSLHIKGHSEIPGYSICECDCGKIKDVSNNLLENKNTKSCGCLKQHNLDNRKILKGSDHPNWKGGISNKREGHMQTKVYKTWRRTIYERDNYTCQKCKQIGYKLRAHHIESYAEHGNKRCDVDNGITFCHKCHLKFHKIYGRNNINKKQLDEFLFQ